jgi:predicted XRE-type DNA-binding protein
MDDNARDERLLARRIRRLCAGRAHGRSWQEVMSDEPRPTTLELASGVLNRVTRTSGELRRALARALRAQGVSIAAIAEQFGVTRQRVSALLRRDAS